MHVVTGSNGENMIRAKGAIVLRGVMSGWSTRPWRVRDVAGVASAGGVGQGTDVQDQGNPFRITACSTGVAAPLALPIPANHPGMPIFLPVITATDGPFGHGPAISATG